MNSRRNESLQDNHSDENIYLSKILLFTQDPIDLAENLKIFSESTVDTNCLNTIGMYPLIFRLETPLGKLCMSIWIINDSPRFNQFRMAYYSGSSHSIILCKNQGEYENISDLYTLTPQGVPITLLSVGNSFESSENILPNSIPDEEHRSPIYFDKINELESISTVFNEIGLKIAQDILSGEYQTFSPQLVKPSNIYKLYNKKSFDKAQNLVNRLGYNLQENGIVTLVKNGFTFEIDFYRNEVKVYLSSCLTCEKGCKHYRKLCVIEEDQGYSNFIHFDNLRALAILYSIHDGNFESLTGDRKHEDIEYQLKKLRTLFEVNCEFHKEEQAFLEQETQKPAKTKRLRKK
ncbi:MAG: hypothetical protein FK732_00530 [Asgard group archaeon]|nr:hypothetical protein [Asgard group archaeon]